MSIIPLNLFQTWHTKNLPQFMRKNVENTKACNPEFTYALYDDNDCREFIKNNFPPIILQTFDSLVPGAYKADLWRYCILFKRGGIYMDIKMVCSPGFKLMRLTQREHFVKDRDFAFDNRGGIYQALLVCKPNNGLLLRCIQQIVRNVRHNYYGYNQLYPTGPGLMGSFTTMAYKNKLALRNIGGNNIYYYTIPAFKTEYNEYRSEQHAFQKTDSYYHLWHRRNIYTFNGDNQFKKSAREKYSGNRQTTVLFKRDLKGTIRSGSGSGPRKRKAMVLG